MKFCQNCGKKLNEGADICLNCGVVVSNNNNSNAIKNGNTTNVLAILGFVFSIVGIFSFIFLIFGVAGLVLSIIGLVKANKEKTGKGLALAGTIIGGVAVLAWLITIFISIGVASNIIDDNIFDYDYYDSYDYWY